MTTVSEGKAKAKAGLEDVVAGESAICYIDGDRGVLSYCGHDIHDLADMDHGVSFEETCFLLWHRRLPTRPELDALQLELAAARILPAQILTAMTSSPGTGNGGMDALRTLTSMLGQLDPDADVRTPEADYRKAVRLTGQLSALVATWGRIAGGGTPVAPDSSLGHAANFLYMLTGTRPSALAARAFDVSLVLHADHELNASTFVARVSAATLTDLHSAVVGAIGALKGPLHGGANAAVMTMLLDIGRDSSLEQAEAHVRAKLARRDKIPGFGHRVYRTEDPRATHLRRFSQSIGETSGQPQWFAMSRRIEQVLKDDKGLNPNVDFYSASMFHALGIPIDLYTPIFAVSRVAGWTAHVLEQYANNRLIRPRTDYIGPSYPQPVVPIDQR